MKRLVKVLLLLLPVVCAVYRQARQQVKSIRINPYARIARDIISMEHHIAANNVIITLQSSNRLCKTPFFVIRMSGTALYLLKLQSNVNNSMVYSYSPIVHSGLYFLEVIALYCTHFNPDHFIGRCMEPVYNGSHVVSLSYHVHLQQQVQPTQPLPQSSSDVSKYSLLARWVNLKSNNIGPLPTRHQLQVGEQSQHMNCSHTLNEDICDAHVAELVSHRAYVWTGAPTYAASLHALLNNSLSHTTEPAAAAANSKSAVDVLKDPVVHICLLGDSHARYMKIFEVLLPYNSSYILISRIPSYFPQQFNTTMLEQFLCSVTFVSYGQWPFSGVLPQPWQRAKFRKEMREVMEKARAYVHNGNIQNKLVLSRRYEPRSKASPHIFIRSENYNGLGFNYTRCPAHDYRTIPVIDMANAVLASLSQEYGLEFIDLTHIVGPLWDGAFDYNHPSAMVFAAELNWMLMYAFQKLLEQNKTVELYERVDVSERKRFIQSDGDGFWNVRKNLHIYS